MRLIWRAGLAVFDDSDILFLSGELLLDLQRYGDSVEKFERAIELEKKRWVQVKGIEVEYP